MFGHKNRKIRKSNQTVQNSHRSFIKLIKIHLKLAQLPIVEMLQMQFHLNHLYLLLQEGDHNSIF